MRLVRDLIMAVQLLRPKSLTGANEEWSPGKGSAFHVTRFVIQDER